MDCGVHPDIKHPDIKHPGVKRSAIKHLGVKHSDIKHPGVNYPGVKCCSYKYPIVSVYQGSWVLSVFLSKVQTQSQTSNIPKLYGL